MKLSQISEPEVFCAALASTQDIFVLFQTSRLILIGYCSLQPNKFPKIIRKMLFGCGDRLLVHCIQNFQ